MSSTELAYTIIKRKVEIVTRDLEFNNHSSKRQADTKGAGKGCLFIMGDGQSPRLLLRGIAKT